MKIVMLGHSSAGKTTYVSLMYALMCEGIEDFSVRTADSHVHRSLSKNAAAIREGRYPNPSQQRSSYDLILQHKKVDVLPFTWRDYRGNALREKSTSSDQAKELYTDLTEADAILLFVDAHRQATCRVSMEIHTLVTHTMRALRDRDSTDLPVLVVLTKCDLLPPDDEEAIERIVHPLLPLLEAIEEAEHVVGGAICVACGPDPFNVELPVLNCLCVGLFSRIAALEELTLAHEREADRLQAGDTLADRIVSWWRGEWSFHELAQHERQMAQEELIRLQSLIEPAQRLESLLSAAFG